jgi:hypothetical protein
MSTPVVSLAKPTNLSPTPRSLLMSIVPMFMVTTYPAWSEGNHS